MTRIYILLLAVVCLTACGTDSKTQTDSKSDLGTTTQDDTDLSVGAIKSACDLITKEEVRALPGFEEVKDLYEKPMSSPDNHMSGCEFLAKSKGLAFILSYNKNAANRQLIDEMIATKGYRLVENLGDKAAFNRKKGYLKWVGANGVMVTAYVFPTSLQTVDAYYEALYTLAKDIDKRFHNS